MDNDLLIISEIKQKAYLPYKYKDIQTIYKNANNKYKSEKQVIDNLYVVPLDNFKNAPFARFREAFNLIVHKEKRSIISALSLALELMFKYNLNPIIIAACRSIDELDIYLDCLDENELFDFRCFEIQFEVSPNVYKKSIKKF